VFQGSRLGTAHGLSLAGSTAGGLLVPVLVAYLIFTWGYRGAVLLQAAILLHTIPASLFYR